MALRLTYLIFSKLLSWMVLRTRSDTTKEIEIRYAITSAAISGSLRPGVYKIGTVGTV